MDDRDQFAAAALTGLLGGLQRYQLGVLSRQAYEIADEMLRERDKNKTRSRTACDSPHAASGPEHKPAAWAVTDSSGEDVYEAYALHQKDEAKSLAEQCLFGRPGPLPMRPLFFSPSLSQAERVAMLVAIHECESMPVTKSMRAADTLREMLERLK